MYPQNSPDQMDPSGPSSFQRERQAEMRQLSATEQALKGDARECPPVRRRSRRWLLALVGALVLALALAGGVAAVTHLP
jgi:hypothetical protein